MWAENKASSRESHDCNKLIIEIEQVSMGARRTHYPIWSLTYAKSNASSQVEVKLIIEIEQVSMARTTRYGVLPMVCVA